MGNKQHLSKRLVCKRARLPRRKQPRAFCDSESLVWPNSGNSYLVMHLIKGTC